MFTLETLKPSLKFTSFVFENLPSIAELLEFDSLLLVSNEKPLTLLLDDTNLPFQLPFLLDEDVFASESALALLFLPCIENQLRVVRSATTSAQTRASKG